MAETDTTGMGAAPGATAAEAGGSHAAAASAARPTVGVALSPPLADEVTAWAEAEAGWEVVGPEGPPAPQLVLADRVRADRPTVVVRDRAVDAATVRQALDEGAVDALAWPDERERLLAAPARVSAAAPARPVPTVRVVALAGGVGASTVAMAVGGLLAWSGRQAVVVGGDGAALLAGLAGWRGPGAAEVAALAAGDAAAEVDALAAPVPGVAGLRLLGGLDRAARAPATAGWPVDAVVVDAGAAAPGPGPAAGEAGAAGAAAESHPETGVGRLVVGAADARLVAARAVAGPLVVVGDGPLSAGQAARLAGRAPAAVLPCSARVRAAALRGRVPAELPGRWLRRLDAGLAAAAPERRGRR